MASTNNGGSSSNSGNNGGMCQAGCGFYGNPAHGGFCSKCYKERMQTPVTSSVAASSSHGPTGMSTPPMEPLSAADLGGSASSLSVSSAAVTAPPAVPVPAPEEHSDAVARPETPTSNTAASSTASLAAHILMPPSPAGSSRSSATGDSGVGITDAAGIGASGAKIQTNKSRCFSCNKKTGLTGFECKCGSTFCGAHRHADAHSCTFDYRSEGRVLIEKLNPKVQGVKLERL